MSDLTHYDEDYFCNGVATGKSSYHDYRWLPNTSLPQADWLKRVLHIKGDDTVFDFGCARGFLIKALRMRGVDAFGCDGSKWAVQNCDPSVKDYITQAFPEGRFDHIIMKDVAEHIELASLKTILEVLITAARKNLLLIVPLTHHPDGPYLRDEDNADPSHVIAQPLEWWMDLLRSVVPLDEGYITGSWHYPGLKPASSEVPKSCGFIQFTRV